MTSYSIYTGRSANWPLVAALSAALLAPLLLLGGLSHGSWLDPAGPALPAALLLVVALTGLSVRTAAGPNGVSVRCGIAGWPRHTYRLTEIDDAEVVDLQPSLWRLPLGFWWTPNDTYYAVRNGPALRLTLRSGRRVTITVPDPHAALTTLREASKH
ncbi:hypothetical protein [Paractinoplanes atraurantiacus]|uniref:Uncharacterized protein n=1 Tax=Paractinoplanes atraurantiacus TaxID=1036182 RepID=A0A285HFN3_9ACTN|nr:hypothetical protein [Actinoplanes atraurantiacus]SNY34454.1 hypothetical protein SAMN05421748_104281 [Actinoplanes atraurantiacus]